MSMLSELNNIFSTLNIPVETGVFTGKAPDVYVVITPFSDTFELYADNLPNIDVHEARISLFSKNNYLESKYQIVFALLSADFTITERLYVGHEDDTGYHHIAIDIAKGNEFMLED